MNAPVPPNESDIKSDMVPILNGWSMDSSRFRDNKSHFYFSRLFSADMPEKMYVRVLDYAAEGKLRVRRADFWGHFSSEWVEIPKNHEQFCSSADPDSDGFTRWEEYRGFCNNDGSHFRLDLDTTAANTRRQIIISDPTSLLDTLPVRGFVTRLQEMMACSLVIKDSIKSNSMWAGCGWEGIPQSWGYFLCIDAKNGIWDAGSNAWEPNPLTIPLPRYSHPAPSDSSSFTRSADQVAIRIFYNDEAGDYGVSCHVFGDPPDWGYGICGNGGIDLRYDLVMDKILREWWPDGSNGSHFNDRDFPGLRDSVITICLRRTVAHEFGHVINVPYHVPNQYDGNNKMCVMLNEMQWADIHTLGTSTDWWWNDWVAVWRDIRSNPNHRWGYMDDNLHCVDSIRYRP
ncbi:hypothetical protein EHM69_04895 [candidate division KSB1 bacterium]|nr:MAG: hypothetical protein EHM69_04895 [candidate division KSB1 bacterium]